VSGHRRPICRYRAPTGKPSFALLTRQIGGDARAVSDPARHKA
jgi:hypothetical protein